MRLASRLPRIGKASLRTALSQSCAIGVDVRRHIFLRRCGQSIQVVRVCAIRITRIHHWGVSAIGQRGIGARDFKRGIGEERRVLIDTTIRTSFFTRA
jgi:hypothetical protein